MFELNELSKECLENAEKREKKFFRGTRRHRLLLHDHCGKRKHRPETGGLGLHGKE